MYTCIYVYIIIIIIIITIIVIVIIIIIIYIIHIYHIIVDRSISLRLKYRMINKLSVSVQVRFWYAGKSPRKYWKLLPSVPPANLTYVFLRWLLYTSFVALGREKSFLHQLLSEKTCCWYPPEKKIPMIHSNIPHHSKDANPHPCRFPMGYLLDIMGGKFQKNHDGWNLPMKYGMQNDRIMI